MAKILTIENGVFKQDGKEVRILSGAMHYFRVVPEYWEDRMRKMRAMGLNTLETYVAWNMHEPRPGEFDFSGQLDLGRYIDIAASLGLNVIVRPGPYICAEWDNGGLPAWLLADPNMRVRCAYKPYVDAVDRFLDALVPVLRPRLATNGGPIIMVQVENEYGSYGHDKEYLNHLNEGLVARGVDVLRFVSDGGLEIMLRGGAIEGLLSVANFGSHAAENFAVLKKFQPTGPLMCGEFWCGWFDHWGAETPIGRSAKSAAEELDTMLTMGASLSMYMFHGGTNFGYMSGANYDGATRKIQVDVTSYDYDAPLTEAGDPTEKFYACQKVIAKHFPDFKPENIPSTPKAAYGKLKMQSSADLLDNCEVLTRKEMLSVTPLTMETLGGDYGFVLYSSEVQGPLPRFTITVDEIRDRGYAFLDGKYCGTFDRNGGEGDVSVEIPGGKHLLQILAEPLARINYGPMLGLDRKGIDGGVRFDCQFHCHWKQQWLPCGGDFEKVAFAPCESAPKNNRPTLFKATLDIDGEPADTYIKLDGWTKGSIFINGFNLGRYWKIGPQHRLYIPAPKLRKGKNEIVILELSEAADSLTVEFVDAPDPRVPRD